MTTPAIPPKAIAYFELGVSLYLWRWQALTLAVENEWGGPDSADKRDWLAGTLSDLFTTNPSKEVDQEDVEDIATQVLNDEFSVVLEDDSAYELSMQLTTCWRDCLAGDFSKIEVLREAFVSAKPGAKSNVKEASSSSEDEEPESERMDVDVQEPVIDDDGFELVQRKRK